MERMIASTSCNASGKKEDLLIVAMSEKKDA